MRTDPKEILRFIERHFEAVRKVFGLQREDSIIRFEALRQVCSHHDVELKKFLEYKILKRYGGNEFQLTTYYQYFLEFILREFSLELPEAISKYHTSISQIFAHLSKEQVSGNLAPTLVNNLIQQVKEFAEAIDNNITRLDEEAKELKSNIKKISYVQKVEKATEWIEYFIKPMNNILDNNHPDSITRKISEISIYANERRLDSEDVEVRLLFEKLYYYLEATRKELLYQLTYLVRTLIPLIHRIKTEAQELSGLIEFMKDPMRHTPPYMFKVTDYYIYSKNADLDAKEIFEHLAKIKPVFNHDESEFVLPWRFEKDKYKELLMDSLPIGNFCQWVLKTLKTKEEKITWEKFMSVSTLVFEKDVAVEINDKPGDIEIKVQQVNLKVPVIKISHGVQGES